MPQRSRVQLFNDISADVITMALRETAMDLREAVLSAIGARQRRMIESDLAAGGPINPRETASVKGSVNQGTYTLHVGGGDIRAARVVVGQQRPSAQDDLLNP